jgi:hypothetical protein
MVLAELPEAALRPFLILSSPLPLQPRAAGRMFTFSGNPGLVAAAAATCSSLQLGCVTGTCDAFRSGLFLLRANGGCVLHPPCLTVPPYYPTLLGDSSTAQPCTVLPEVVDNCQ